MKRSTWLKLAPYLFTFAFFAIWEVACRVFAISGFILPPAGLSGNRAKLLH